MTLDAERAETYLRRLAESELRRELTRSRDEPVDPRTTPIARVGRTAAALRAVRALEEETLSSILIEFDTALAIRTVTDQRMLDAGVAQSILARTQEMQRGPTAVSAGPRQALRVVPIGRIVSMADGIVVVAAMAVTTRTAKIIVALSAHSPLPRLVRPAQLRLRGFRGADNTGGSYQLSFDGHENPMWMFGYLDVSPRPPPDARWLDLLPGPDEPAVRLDLTAPATAAHVSVEPARTSPGELLLDVMAAAMLATEGTHGESPLPPDIVHQWTIGLGEIVAALEAAGALPADTPVPGRLATLCGQLDAHQHGISARPRADLPDRWASVLAQYRQRGTRRREPGGVASLSSRLAVVLPELDGARYTLAGLHSEGGRTLLTIHASGIKIDSAGLLPFGPERYPASSWWLRDNAVRWHVTTMAGRFDEGGGDQLLQLRVLPALDRAVTSLDLVITGQSDRLRAHLPVSWRQAQRSYRHAQPSYRHAQPSYRHAQPR